MDSEESPEVIEQRRVDSLEMQNVSRLDSQKELDAQTREARKLAEANERLDRALEALAKIEGRDYRPNA